VIEQRLSDPPGAVKVVRSYSVDREHHAYLRWRAANGSLKVSAELQHLIEADARQRLGADWREQFAGKAEDAA
jgi:hypothetical protein